MASGTKITLKFLYDLEQMGEKAFIDWFVNEVLISNRYKCPVCAKDMHLVKYKD